MKYKLYLVITLIAAILYLKSFAVGISAQEVKLSISPPLVSVVVRPGKSLLIAYELLNGADPVIISPSVLPFMPGQASGEMVFQSKATGPITFNLENADRQLQEPFFLQTGEKQQLLLKITVPESAPNGDYYYSFLAASQPPRGDEQATNPTAKATIGATILLTVSDSGKVQIKAHIKKLSIVARYPIRLPGFQFNIVESTDTIPVSLVVNNDGKNLVTTGGTIQLIGNFGERATYTINPANILALSSREVTATPSAEMRENKRASLFIRGFFLGKYRVTAEVDFGDNSPKLHAATTFYAFPIKLTFGLLIALSVSLFIRRKIRERE